jgi:hypothetical protein
VATVGVDGRRYNAGSAPQMQMLPKHEQKMARLLAAIQEEVHRDLPLIVGPWTGEVGYENLYWVPFVRWALATFQVPAERVIIVSRGDAASWYSGIGSSQYVDAFDLMSPSELAALGQGRKPKQYAFDDEGGDEVCRRVQARCGFADVARLLPHWMYRLYSPYWKGDAPLDLIDQHARWTRIEPPAPAALVEALPPRFLAVRFYFSRSLPDLEENRRFAETMIDRLAAHLPVVLLNHPFVVDDHSDYQPASIRVTSVSGFMSPATNLAVQTAVIGRAAGFVGTYGGLSFVPSLCGVPTFAFGSVRFTKPAHERAIRRMIERSGGAPLLVADAGDGVAQAGGVLAQLSAWETDSAGATPERV